MLPKFTPTLFERVVGFEFKLMRTAWGSGLWYYFMETSFMHVFTIVSVLLSDYKFYLTDFYFHL